MRLRSSRLCQVVHEHADVLAAGRVEANAEDAPQVLAVVDEMVPVAVQRPVLADPCVVGFDCLGDQLLVGQLHSQLLESVEEQSRGRVEERALSWACGLHAA